MNALVIVLMRQNHLTSFNAQIQCLLTQFLSIFEGSRDPREAPYLSEIQKAESVGQLKERFITFQLFA